MPAHVFQVHLSSSYVGPRPTQVEDDDLCAVVCDSDQPTDEPMCCRPTRPTQRMICTACSFQ